MASGIEAKYSLDEVLVVFMFSRISTLFPLIHRKCNLHTVKAQLAAKLNNVSISVPFTFKAILMDSPISTISFSLSVWWAYLAHCLLIAERGSYSMECIEERNFEECPFILYQNCSWNIGITMTTVGYGDIYPKSDPGRAVALVACLVGTMFISTLVSVIDTHTQFQQPELNVLQFVKKDDASVLMMYLAASRIQHAWRALLLSKNKTHPLNLYAQTKKALAFSRIAGITARWRNFLLTFK